MSEAEAPAAVPETQDEAPPAESSSSVPKKKKISKNTKKGTRYGALRIHGNKDGAVDSETVKLPPDMTPNRWISSNTVDFYHATSDIVGLVSEFVTADAMTAGPKYKYLWPNPETNTPEQIPARAYMENVLQWVQGILDNEKAFPPEGKPFPADFGKIVKKIFTRLFRIYAHIYRHCYEKVLEDGSDGQLNRAYRRFTHFALEFDLIDVGELMPLAHEIVNFVPDDKCPSFPEKTLKDTAKLSAAFTMKIDRSVADDAKESVIPTSAPEVPSTPLAEWTTPEVIAWLKSLAPKAADYVGAFEEMGVTGKDLADLDDEVLESDFGVDKKFLRTKILNGIKDLQ